MHGGTWLCFVLCWVVVSCCVVYCCVALWCIVLCCVAYVKRNWENHNKGNTWWIFGSRSKGWAAGVPRVGRALGAGRGGGWPSFNILHKFRLAQKKNNPQLCLVVQPLTQGEQQGGCHSEQISCSNFKIHETCSEKTMEWSPNLQHKNRNQWWHKGVINKNTGGS